MSTISQTDVRHDCKSRMWHCSNCRIDFCMAEQPAFCPMCGFEPEWVTVRPEHTDYSLPHVKLSFND